MKKVISLILAICTVTSLMMLSGCAGFMPDETDGSLFIREIKKLGITEEGEVEVGIFFTDEEIDPVVFTIPAGAPGEQGVDGNGILGITHEHDDELNRTKITVTFTNEETYDFYVKDGLMVEDIVPGNDELNGAHIRFLYNDGTLSDIIPLPKGDAGVGIVSYDQIVNEDKSVRGLFLLSDGTEVGIDIPAPQTGNGIANMVSKTANGKYIITVTYTNGDKQVVDFDAPKMWYKGESAPDDRKGVEGDYFFDTKNKVIYIKDAYTVETNGEDGETVTETKTKWNILINFKDQLDTYNVTFHLNDGSDEIPATYRIKRGTYFKDNGYGNIPVPTRDGYRFVGWYTQRTIENPAVMSPFTDLTAVFGNLDLYAIWVEE